MPAVLNSDGSVLPFIPGGSTQTTSLPQSDRPAPSMMSYHCSARLVTPREHLMKNVLCAVVAFSVVTAATAQPIVKKNQPEKGYSIKPAAVKVALWSDKNYAIAL